MMRDCSAVFHFSSLFARFVWRLDPACFVPAPHSPPRWCPHRRPTVSSTPVAPSVHRRAGGLLSVSPLAFCSRAGPTLPLRRQFDSPSALDQSRGARVRVGLGSGCGRRVSRARVVDLLAARPARPCHRHAPAHACGRGAGVAAAAASALFSLPRRPSACRALSVRLAVVGGGMGGCGAATSPQPLCASRERNARARRVLPARIATTLPFHPRPSTRGHADPRPGM